MAKARTVLLRKDRTKGNATSNYRYLACLPIVWKLITMIFAVKIYGRLKQQQLFPKEQKEYKKGPRYQWAVVREVQSTKNNLKVAQTIVRNFDDALHSWIAGCLDMFRVATNDKIISIISMGKWSAQ